MRMRTNLLAMIVISCVQVSCGRDEKSKSGHRSGFEMAYITILPEQNGQSTNLFEVTNEADLAAIHIGVRGVKADQITTGLYNAPQDLYLTRTNDQTSTAPANSTSELTYYYLTGPLPKAGVYKLKVVARHIENCLAKINDGTRCRDGRFLGAIDDDFDATYDVTLNIKPPALAPTNSTTTTDQGSYDPNSNQGGGLFSWFQSFLGNG